MKRLIATLLLTLYAPVLLRPVAPYAGYVLNQTYIAGELCENRDKPGLHCNGMCYLNKQLLQAGAASQKPENAPNSANDRQLVSEHLCNGDVASPSVEAGKVGPQAAPPVCIASQFKPETPHQPPQAAI